ncbi:MAG TPA: efflux RND transporter periplasmic adaptor subunit, partial [Candidatus Limnocylindria bacterium]|nr:efflux RND transporter periplasmic adaptor subunit [Candidatus Limnocylindria bacterium]
VAGTSRVYVIKDEKAEERIVTLGQAAGSEVEITSGVAKGEIVVAEPRGRIVDGQAVRSNKP